MFRKIEPTDQNANNSLNVFKSESGCCGSTDNLKKCLYEVAIASFANVASFTIDDEGTEKEIAFDASITDSAKIKDAVIAKAKANGYVLDDDPLDIQVSESGGSVTIKVWGELKITKFTNAASTDYAVTEKCSKKVVSDYDLAYTGGTDPVLSVDGTTSTVSGTFANSAAGATSLQTALANALSGEQSITVTHDASVPTLKIKVVYDNATELKLANKQFTESNVTRIFVA